VTRSTPPIPSREDLLTLAQAALCNTEELLADARLLAEAGRFPRAHALATLACEELGKEQACIRASWKPITKPNRFWNDFSSHTQKLWYAQTLALLESVEPIGAVDIFNRHVREGSWSAHVRKLRGLYVGYVNGEVQVPGEITEHETRQLISNAHAVLDRCKASWSWQVEQAKMFAQQPLAVRCYWILFLAWLAYTHTDTLEKVLRDGWSPEVLDHLHTFKEQIKAAGSWTAFFDGCGSPGVTLSGEFRVVCGVVSGSPVSVRV
jgi:AbiV family abortive infection protein